MSSVTLLKIVTMEVMRKSQQCDEEIDVRLVGGNNATSGRVEVKHHGVGGTVCIIIENIWKM